MSEFGPRVLLITNIKNGIENLALELVSGTIGFRYQGAVGSQEICCTISHVKTVRDLVPAVVAEVEYHAAPVATITAQVVVVPLEVGPVTPRLMSSWY